MSNTTTVEGFEVSSRPKNDVKVARKTFMRRIFDKMAANAERQAFARLAATDPRMAADLRAAWDRAVGEAKT